MDTLKFMQSRYSVRAFNDKAVEKEKINRILEAGRLAPSACNKQPWIFLVIEDSSAKEKLQSCYPRPWFSKAAFYILVLGNHQESWRRPSGDSVDIDTSIATTQMMLQAHNEGLGCTWVCAFDQDACSKKFHLPQYIEPVSILALGYPDISEAESPQKKRKPLSDVVKYNEF